MKSKKIPKQYKLTTAHVLILDSGMFEAYRFSLMRGMSQNYEGERARFRRSILSNSSGVRRMDILFDLARQLLSHLVEAQNTTEDGIRGHQRLAAENSKRQVEAASVPRQEAPKAKETKIIRSSARETKGHDRIACVHSRSVRLECY